MSVEHEALYGLGARVNLVNLKEEDCPIEYLDKCLRGSNFVHFQTGDDYARDPEFEYFVVLPEKYENPIGIDTLDELNKLESFLENHPDLEIADYEKIGLVGGLYVF